MLRHAFDSVLGNTLPLLLVPAAALDPLTGPRLVGRHGHHADNLVPAADIVQIQDQLRFAKAEKVSMPFDESRHGEAAVEFYDGRIRADVRRNLLIAADGRDAVAVYRQCLDVTQVRVHSGNLAARQHQVGRCHIGGRRGFLRFPAAGHKAKCSQRGREQNYQVFHYRVPSRVMLL